MENIITFSGNNDQLFARVVVDNLFSKPRVIVPETHNAIVVKDGQMLQTLGSGKYFLETFVDLKNESSALLEVLFFSKTAKLKLLWGTANKFSVVDEKSQENFLVGMSGNFEVQVHDPRKFYLYVVGAAKELSADELQERLMSNVTAMTENAVLEFVKAKKVACRFLMLEKADMSRLAKKSVEEKLLKEYGISVFSFNIANIIVESENQKAEQRADFINCKNCGQLLSGNSKFCIKCGNAVGSLKKCLNCGKENVEEARFCAHCGCEVQGGAK